MSGPSRTIGMRGPRSVTKRSIGGSNRSLVAADERQAHASARERVSRQLSRDHRPEQRATPADREKSTRLVPAQTRRGDWGDSEDRRFWFTTGSSPSPSASWPLPFCPAVHAEEKETDVVYERPGHRESRTDSRGGLEDERDRTRPDETGSERDGGW